MERYVPGYLKLLASGELEKRVQMLRAILEDCTLCPHHCRVNRIEHETGLCRAGAVLKISGYGPHYGEEDVLVGTRGSGTVFFSYCTLRCVFCQNYEISQQGEGHEISSEELAQLMLKLQARGCHNINLVSPTHFVPQIVAAISIASQAGLSLPVVYNTGGYDDLNTLRLLDGIIDIYMPDLKFGDNKKAQKYTGAKKYFDWAKLAIKEMHRQVGDLQTDARGIAFRGLLVRHLILPEDLANTEAVLKFIAEEVSSHTLINLMDQYYPYYKAYAFPELTRRINWEEYVRAVEMARDLGLDRLIGVGKVMKLP